MLRAVRTRIILVVVVNVDYLMLAVTGVVFDEGLKQVVVEMPTRE
jgi:hypothetical protein